MYDVLIIGGGPGGIYASTMAALNKLKSCIVESLPSLGGQPNFIYPLKGIHDFPGFISILGGDVASMLISQLNSLVSDKPDLFLNTYISKIKREGESYVITLSTGQLITSRSIIIATGNMSLTPKKISVNDKEVEQDNVRYIFESDEYYRNLEVVILGGGDSALDWAIHLSNKKIAKKVSLIYRSKELRSRKGKIEQMLDSRINTYLDFSISMIENNQITIIDNMNKNSKILYFDTILVQYGLTPSKNKISDLLEKIEMNGNKIIVNETFESSINMIYAIGQASTYVSKPNLIIVSISEAAKAIYSITWKLKESLKNGS